MPSLDKEVMLNEVRKEFEANPYIFISNFSGVPVADISECRRGLEKVANRSMTIKHSFVKKIIEECRFQGAEAFLGRNVFVTFADKEPQAVSKALVAYTKNNKNFLTQGIIFEKKVYGQAFVTQLAELPSKKELLTQAVVRIKSPISGFVLTLSQVIRGAVQVLNEIKKQKEAASPAA